MAPGKGRANGGIIQFLFRQFFAGFARNQQRLQTVHFLQRHVVGGLRAVVAAGGFIELLLRNQLVLNISWARLYFWSASKRSASARCTDAIFLGSVGAGSGAHTELRANLLHDSALAIHFKLQFLGVEHDERLAFVDGVAHIRQHLSTRPSTCALTVLSSRARSEPTACTRRWVVSSATV